MLVCMSVALLGGSIGSVYAQEDPKCKKECCKKCNPESGKCNKEESNKGCKEKSACTKATAKA